MASERHRTANERTREMIRSGPKAVRENKSLSTRLLRNMTAKGTPEQQEAMWGLMDNPEYWEEKERQAAVAQYRKIPESKLGFNQFPIGPGDSSGLKQEHDFFPYMPQEEYNAHKEQLKAAINAVYQ
tara:strand:- start:214 stop:594 length:381 start_codon:yes stop_codon:yes gene_type:complete